ncbi:MAG: hypothetical protein J6V07_01160, partial [Clostridia bacterium]|nr:hypothetical protein [Clostridia bacterium]
YTITVSGGQATGTYTLGEGAADFSGTLSIGTAEGAFGIVIVNGAPLSDRAEFALIPIGTGNDFCRNFDDRAAFFDIGRQIDGEAMPIDLISYNGKYCVNMLNIGIDCNVVERTVKFKRSKLVPSSMAYSLGIVSALMHKMTTPMQITLEDGEVIDRPLLLLSIANGRYYGGGFLSNPRATLDDGLFDVNIIEKVSRITFLSLIGSYKAGTHLETAPQYITYRKSTSLTIHFEKETMMCVDGETEPVTDLEISLVPKAARLSSRQGSPASRSIGSRRPAPRKRPHPQPRPLQKKLSEPEQL